MSLGIFSFDLAAIIGSLTNFIDAGEPSKDETSLDKTETVLQTATASDSVAAEALMAAALSSAATPFISSSEKKENLTDKTPAYASRVPPLDDETRREIERLIKVLQTSVVHNYRSTDIIDEMVALDNVAHFPKRKTGDESDAKKESIEQQKKQDSHKLERLREELRRAILRNNSEV